MADPLSIRAETAADYAAIRQVNELTFGRPNEANLVEALRQADGFQCELSLVTELNGQIVGHILFSPIRIGDAPAMALAPMAVLPKHQRRGIGSRLVKHGLIECARLNHRLVIVLGHPEYYLRFGFLPAMPHGIQPPFDVPSEAFMVIDLTGTGLANVGGVVAYPPAFSSV